MKSFSCLGRRRNTYYYTKKMNESHNYDIIKMNEKKSNYLRDRVKLITIDFNRNLHISCQIAYR